MPKLPDGRRLCLKCDKPFKPEYAGLFTCVLCREKNNRLGYTSSTGGRGKKRRKVKSSEIPKHQDQEPNSKKAE